MNTQSPTFRRFTKIMTGGMALALVIVGLFHGSWARRLAALLFIACGTVFVLGFAYAAFKSVAHPWQSLRRDVLVAVAAVGFFVVLAVVMIWVMLSVK